MNFPPRSKRRVVRGVLPVLAACALLAGSCSRVRVHGVQVHGRDRYRRKRPDRFPPLPASSPWNADVSTLPVDPRSETYLSSIGMDTEVHADFGTVWNGAPNGIPYVLVRSTQKKVPITFYYGDESDPGPYPIPANPPIEGGPRGTGDRHILTLDVDNRLLYEVYDARYNSRKRRWEAGSGAIWDLKAVCARPDGWTSADAAGLPMLPGLVRYDEVARGEITHALRFTVPETRRAYIYPASHFASDSTDDALPPMGMRVRLRADYDVSGFPRPVRVILTALKRYGMIVADNGGPFYISGVPDPRWDDELLHAISQVRAGDFEVVDTSGLEPASPLVYAGRSIRVSAGRNVTRSGCRGSAGCRVVGARRLRGRPRLHAARAECRQAVSARPPIRPARQVPDRGHGEERPRQDRDGEADRGGDAAVA